jgi:hypothetical protein
MHENETDMRKSVHESQFGIRTRRKRLGLGVILREALEGVGKIRASGFFDATFQVGLVGFRQGHPDKRFWVDFDNFLICCLILPIITYFEKVRKQKG